MSDPVLIPLAADDRLAKGLAETLGADLGRVEIRSFPDGETYLRYETPVAHRSVCLLRTLDRPDSKILPVLFAAAAARDAGAERVGLIAPYLAYMRQDRRFRPGEAVTATDFAKILSAQIDWLVTVDPHLHRHADLSELYSVPAIAVHAAPLMSTWIGREVERPLLIGPDSESAQWVGVAAREADLPHVVLRKIRHGDRTVEISVPEIERWQGRTPVLIDDIVSTARTMIETVRHLQRTGMPAPVCIAVHGIFAGDAYRELLAAGAARVVTCNTVPHETNAIDVTGLLADGVRAALT
ncbi:ribose-phosphate pyrophosphokinase [Rhodoligotrophos defluvii]|uniref:ribose-phosphate pyrophosphokinase n=1 Tax=Rhodoligotrophos defluvii TaxID=2561934 RepID=UPI0010C96152|nr:ribose-phosphate pyrophosphokinase [Rhodoligotrophos defluvii]